MAEPVRFITTGYYVNPGAMTAIGVIFPVLGAITVASRFVVRAKYNIPVMMDDWLCIPALVCVAAQGVLYIYGAKRQLLGDRLPPDMSPEEVKIAVDTIATEKLRLIEFACNMISALSTGLIRLSFLFFYRRIFRGKPFNSVNWTMIAATTAWTIAMIVTYFSVCPYYLRLDDTLKKPCGRMLYFLGAYSITGFVLDLAILLMPFPWLTKRQIWRLRLPVTQKWAVSSVFLCGSFTVAASCVRMVCGIEVLLEKPGQYLNIIGLKSYGDIVGGAGVWLFWSYIENGTGMVVVCLPSLAPLLRYRVLKRRVAQCSTENLALSQTAPKVFPPLSTVKHSQSTNDLQGTLDEEVTKPSDAITVTRTVDQYRVST